ncbi:hypothetical protein VCR4J2_30160 [Vibrio coralliirubri]|nr:hypothetical protein VCR4J2_30160 [Vibrio coralliirubri]
MTDESQEHRVVLFLYVLVDVGVYGSVGSAARAFNSIYFLRFPRSTS